MTETISASEVKRLKGLGCLRDKRYNDRFNVRVITRNGKITAKEQHDIAEAAELFGSGEITMTTRLTLEIQGVPYDNIENLFEFLKEKNLQTGGTGALVRPVVSCKGTTCQYGLIDTFALSEELHHTYYEGWHDITLPHKFKIGVGGCPNNCIKPELNDLGIVGQKLFKPDLNHCRGCKVCQVVERCPMDAASVVDGKLEIDPTLCNHCGLCVEKCPFHVIDVGTQGFKVYIGGRWGKKVNHGQALSKIFTSHEEVSRIIEKTLLVFRTEGKKGERFAETITRLGFDVIEKKILNETIDKEQSLKKTVIGGANC